MSKAPTKTETAKVEAEGRAKLDYDPDKETSVYTEKNRPDLAAQLLNPLGGAPTRSATSKEDITEPVKPGET